MQISVLEQAETREEVQEVKSRTAVDLHLTGHELDRHEIYFHLSIDLSFPRAQILDEIDKALRPFIPYRSVDPRIFEAVELYEREGNLSFVDVSQRVFCNKNHVGKIRNWYNKIFGGER